MTIPSNTSKSGTSSMLERPDPGARAQHRRAHDRALVGDCSFFWFFRHAAPRRRDDRSTLSERIKLTAKAGRPWPAGSCQTNKGGEFELAGQSEQTIVTGWYDCDCPDQTGRFIGCRRADGRGRLGGRTPLACVRDRSSELP
jgi:hypothetical protein